MNISISAGGKKPPTKEPPKGKKPKYNKRAHTNRKRANLEHPVKEIRDHTTESHRIPTTEFHPTKTASKAEHQVAQTQTKRAT